MIAIPVSECVPESAEQLVRLDLGGAVWELRSNIRDLRIELDHRTCEFISRDSGLADVVVEIDWVDSLIANHEILFDAGLWRSSTSSDGLQFDFFTERLGSDPYKRAVFNADFSYGRVLLNRRLLSGINSYYPLEYPLDELASMHRLGLGHGIELHSCGLATKDGRGFLFVGHSGAGKSTLGKNWVQHRGATILSDDRVVVTKGDSYRIHGTPWHGEAGLAKNARAHLRAIFLIQHGDVNHAEPLSPGRAAAELLSRSFVPWYREQNLDFTLRFLQQLTNNIPVYVFRCLPDRSAVEFLERKYAI